MSEQLHVVLGATGGIGSAVVRALAASGCRVRAVSRTIGRAELPGVEAMAADVATAEGARTACVDAAVVYHCAQPAYTRWAQEFPALNEQVLAGASGAGAKLVFADNLYPYAPAGRPITEQTPQQPDSRKGRLRLALAERLLAAGRAGQLRVTLGRASDYYGPGGLNSVAGAQLFDAVRAGKPVRWPADVDQPHTLHYLDDVALGLVRLGADARADGQAWVLPAAEPLTARQFVSLAAEQAGTASSAQPTGKAMMRLAGLVLAPARELPDIWYQYAEPFTADGRAFQEAFGPLPVTPHATAVAATLAWFADRGAAPSGVSR